MKNRWTKSIARGVVLAALVVTTTTVHAEQKTIVIRDGKVVKDGDLAFAFNTGDLVSRGYLGVSLIELTPELRQNFKVPEGKGVMVSTVSKDSPAEKAGLKAGDILTGIDGSDVDRSADVSRQIRKKKDGEPAKIEFYRNGVKQQAFASIAERKRPEIDMKFFSGDEDMIIGPRIRESLGNLTEVLEGPEWKARIEAMQDCSKVEARLKEVEKRLKDLEKKLDK